LKHKTDKVTKINNILVGYVYVFCCESPGKLSNSATSITPL